MVKQDNREASSLLSRITGEKTIGKAEAGELLFAARPGARCIEFYTLPPEVVRGPGGTGAIFAGSVGMKDLIFQTIMKSSSCVT